ERLGRLADPLSPTAEVHRRLHARRRGGETGGRGARSEEAEPGAVAEWRCITDEQAERSQRAKHKGEGGGIGEEKGHNPDGGIEGHAERGRAGEGETREEADQGDASPA